MHIGAFAPQVPQVDAVVNETWIPTLGMKPDNALLINTGLGARRSRCASRSSGSPATRPRSRCSTRWPGSASTPACSRPPSSSAASPTRSATFNYTVLGGGRIAPDPAWVSSHIGTAAVPILGSVTCNKLIFPQLAAALREIVERGPGRRDPPG